MGGANFNIYRFFGQARAAGFTAFQFSDLIATGQYATVYRKAIQHVRAGDQALDWGAGNGHFAYFLLGRGVQVTTFSFSADAPAYGAAGNLTHVAGDPDEPVALPFRGRSFDQVFSIGVLEHVHETGGDQIASLREIERILKPGGLFLCFHLPNRHGWVEPMKKLLRPDAHEHSRKFVQADIERLCLASGFDLLSVGRYNFLPRNEAGKLLRMPWNSRVRVAAFNALDRLLTALMPRLATNYYFVAQKPLAWPALSGTTR